MIIRLELPSINIEYKKVYAGGWENCEYAFRGLYESSLPCSYPDFYAPLLF